MNSDLYLPSISSGGVGTLPTSLGTLTALTYDFACVIYAAGMDEAMIKPLFLLPPHRRLGFDSGGLGGGSIPTSIANLAALQ